MRTLWIIDIDGTLINVHKNQVPAWNKAMKESLGFIPDEKILVSYFGKPFKTVFRNVALHYGISQDQIQKNYDQGRLIYTTEVSNYLKRTGGETLPGAVEFLKYLGKVGAVLAIATGNPQEEGEFKLKYFDLHRYFDITVYADDRSERIEMVKEAIRQGQEKYNLPLSKSQQNVVIIGDSVHDVESAKLINGTSVAVTTGQTTKEKLASYTPDFLFDGLADYQSVVDQVIKSL